jgi:RecJ-like exonuclease
MRRDVEFVRVLCRECGGAGEFETTTSSPDAVEPPTVLCRNCYGTGYVFVPIQQSLEFPDVELPDDYDPFALEEETQNEREHCQI